MKKRGILVWALTMVAVACAPAVAQDFAFTHIDTRHGLSHNHVTCFLKDRTGFLWIGTASGLDRFDGYSMRVFRNDPADSASISNDPVEKLFELPDGRIGVMAAGNLNVYDPVLERFHSDTTGILKRYGIPSGVVSDVIRDHKGDSWFLRAGKGLVYYPQATGRVSVIKHDAGDTTSIATDRVANLANGGGGEHWVVHTNGIVERLSLVGDRWRVSHRNQYLFRKNKGALLEYRLLVDDLGDLWIYVANDNQGVYFFNMDLGLVLHLDQSASAGRLSTNLVSGIVQADARHFWIATDHGGINVIDKNSLNVQYISNRDEVEKSLGQNSPTTLYRDDTGIIWVGTFKKGVSYYHENIIRFPVYKHYASDPVSLPYEDVNRFVEDHSGNLWIGTNGGGLIYFNRKDGSFKTYRHKATDPHSLSSDVIVSLCIDRTGKLWIGTYYGGLNCFDGKKFRRYTHNPGDPNSLAGRSVWEVFEDSGGRLWIGMLDGGLDLYDARTETFTHYRLGNLNTKMSLYVSAITEDSDGNLWIGTDTGIDVLMRDSGRFVHYDGGKKGAGELRNASILDIREDGHQRLWIATQGGLSLFDKNTQTFRTFTEQDGLPHNMVLTLLEDGIGGLWMSTPNGISHLIITTNSAGRSEYRFRNYDEADGLQANQFNENAAFRTKRGELIFGGAGGFNIFKPENMRLNKVPPKVVLSDFQLYSQSVKPGQEVDGQVILPAAITQAEKLVLPSDKNVFSLEFTALNFFHPEKNQYLYKLEGFNTDWLPADGRGRKVTFTNLDPGDYVFRVKAANNDGYWNEHDTQLKITILPPFWRTKTAFALYLLAGVLALWLVRKLIQQHEQMKYAIEDERREALRLHELDMMKLRFFTNVSHEFRTPLSLILAPLEKLLKQAGDTEQQSQYQLIQRNAKRLLNLVNQLLDFRKLEVQEVRFNPAEGDVIRFISDTVHSFSDLSEKKGIVLTYQTTVAALETVFDPDKLEKILFNLLSNAFKFTAEQGSVGVHVSRNQTDGMLEIKVSDTGIGITPDKQERIFDRFFQSDLPRTMVNQGSGIGLSIVKEFVRICGGTVSVESEPGKGSCFGVRLPVQEVTLQSISPAPEPVVIADAMTETELVDVEANDKRPLLLLIEDNEDFRFYLKDNLRYDYRVVEACNGREGWKQVLKHVPDLMVSDVMMPEMNGIELCRKVKSDARVSHIPVILLTARTTEEQKLEGLESGADDYVTKPFNFEILQSRMRNLVQQREKFHRAFSRKVDVQASTLKITSVDEKLIQEAIACVERHASNPDFSVDMLSREVGISRAHFYKKIVALTGKSPLEFIRAIRLQRAAQLLEKSQLTVAEVAYQVGFNNPKYFTRYFKEVYSVLPSAYAAGKRKNHPI